MIGIRNIKPVRKTNFSKYLPVFIIAIVVIGFTAKATYQLVFKDVLPNRDIETRITEPYKANLTGSISWDNYCFPKQLTIQDLSQNTTSTFSVPDYFASHCATNGSYHRLEFKDFNHDNYVDLRLHLDAVDSEAKSGGVGDKTYLYYPPTNTFFEQNAQF